MRKIKVLNLEFFLKINHEVVSRYRKHIFGTTSNGSLASDIDGKNYPDYKDKGVKKSKGTGRRQRTAYKLSKAPVFTGDLMNDFQLRKTTGQGFSFGTVLWGSTANFLSDKGRIITDERKPLPESVMKYITTEANNYVQKKLNKIKGGKINV